MYIKKLQLILLVGGRSTRMGQDKSYLTLEELNGFNFFENALILLLNLQQKYLNFTYECPHNNQLFTLNINLALSCREEQKDEFITRLNHFAEKHKILKDCFEESKQSRVGDIHKIRKAITNISFIFDQGLGVCEAIIQCLEQSKSDILLIPCDVPFLKVSLLQKLVDTWIITQRNEEYQKISHFVFEPVGQKSKEHWCKKKRIQESLIAIYTQNALPALRKSVQNNNSLQKAICPSSTKKIFYTTDEVIFFQNMNSKEDLIFTTSNLQKRRFLMSDVLCLVATMTAKEEYVDLVRDEMLKLIPPTRQEKGCILYDLHQGNKEKNVFILYEKWNSYGEWQDHRKTEHMLNFANVTEGKLLSRTVIELTKFDA